MNVIKRASRWLAGLVPTLLIVAGAAAVSYAMAMVFVPAGVACAGILAIAGGVLMVRGGDGP